MGQQGQEQLKAKERKKSEHRGLQLQRQLGSAMVCYLMKRNGIGIMRGSGEARGQNRCNMNLFGGKTGEDKI